MRAGSAASLRFSEPRAGRFLGSTEELLEEGAAEQHPSLRAGPWTSGDVLRDPPGLDLVPSMPDYLNAGPGHVPLSAAMGGRAAWAAVGRFFLRGEQLLAGTRPERCLTPSTPGGAGRGGAALLLSNRSLQGGDASLAHQSLSTMAMEHCGKSLSQHPVTCMEA